MNIAKEIANLSTCCKHKVGCVLIKDDRIISIGYNGTYANEIHCTNIFNNKYDLNKEEERNKFCEEHHIFASLYEVHAEQNCISNAAKEGIVTNNSIAFVTLEPCSDCLKLLIASGVSKVIYDKQYDRAVDSKLRRKYCVKFSDYIQNVHLAKK